MFATPDPSSSKMRSSKRIVVLEPINGKAEDTSGMIDKRLFTGENNLNVVMNEQTTLWSIHYDRGITPEPLRQQFTSFKKALQFIEGYFKRRNIRVKEVKD